MLTIIRTRIWLIVMAGYLLAGCAELPGWLSLRPQSEQALQQSLSAEQATNRELDEKLAEAQLQLLERDVLTVDLNKKLDEATLEVVRTKAMLQSLESKAEAASTLAEGEIALKALKARGAWMDGSGLTQAEAMLNKSNQELKKENYGGALYLAAQAKSLIKYDQDRLRNQENTVPLKGEISLAIPLPLRVDGPANVRKGPGLDMPVLFSLKEGDTLKGYSYRGVWVRIKTEDGRSGWIHYSLISGRSRKS
jgi:hypothetical protein